MRHKSGLPPKEARARDRVVQMAIGRMLSAQYDLAAPLSERLENLLKRLENTDEVYAVEIGRTQACREVGSRAAAFASVSRATAARSPSSCGSK